MEMHCPFLVITTHTVPFKMWNRNCLILILTFQPFQSLKLGEIFVRWEIELRHASSPLPWNLETDPNSKLFWPNRVVAREDNKYRDTQKTAWLGLAKIKAFCAACTLCFSRGCGLCFDMRLICTGFVCCQCTRSWAVLNNTSVQDNNAFRLKKAEIPRA